MFLAPTTLGRRVTRSLVCLKAVSVYVWSGGTGLPKEPDFWTPWVFSSFIFVKQGGGLPSGRSGCPKDQKDGFFFHHFGSLALFEEAGFLTLPPLPQGCSRGFDFILSPKSHFFWGLPSSFPGGGFL